MLDGIARLHPELRVWDHMLNATDLIIVSDLHLAAERDRGLFRADKELAAFLLWVAENATEGTCLVLNGDAFDFLVLEKETAEFHAFDPAAAAVRMRAILDAHEDVIAALKDLITKGRCQVVVLGGNHDPELILPEVQQVIEQRVGDGRLCPRVRWLVHGQAFPTQVGPVRVLIEHGHHFDDWNRVDYDLLRSAAGLASRRLTKEHRYKPPLGSRLIVEHLLELRRNFPWIDMLKPERPAVVSVLRSILPSSAQVKALLWFVWDERAEIVASKLRQLWEGDATADRLRVAPSQPDVTFDPADMDWDNVRARWTRERLRFSAWLEDALREYELRALALQPSEERVIAELRRVAATDDFFDPSRSAGTLGDIRFLLEHGNDVVVAGHTHSAKAHRVRRGLYLNSGTWTQLLSLPSADASDEEWQIFLRTLRTDPASVTGVCRPSFVRLGASAEDGAVEAGLWSWNDDAPTRVAAHSFAKQANGAAWVQ